MGNRIEQCFKLLTAATTLALSAVTVAENRPGFDHLQNVVDRPIYAEIVERLGLTPDQHAELDPLFESYLVSIQSLDVEMGRSTAPFMAEIKQIRSAGGDKAEVDHRVAEVMYQASLTGYKLRQSESRQQEDFLAAVEGLLTTDDQRSAFATIRPLIFCSNELYYPPDIDWQTLERPLDFSAYVETMFAPKENFAALLATDVKAEGVDADQPCVEASRSAMKSIRTIGIDFEQKYYVMRAPAREARTRPPEFHPQGSYDLDDASQRQQLQRALDYPRLMYQLLRESSNRVLATLDDLAEPCGSEFAAELRREWTDRWRQTLAPVLFEPAAPDDLLNWCTRIVGPLEPAQVERLSGIAESYRTDMAQRREAALNAFEAAILRPRKIGDPAIRETLPIRRLAEMRNTIATALNQTRAILTDPQRARYDQEIESMVISVSHLLGPQGRWESLKDDGGVPIRAVKLIYHDEGWSFVEGTFQKYQAKGWLGQ